MSKIIVPLHISDNILMPGIAEPGFKKFYIQNGYFKLLTGTTAVDLILDRPLDNFTPVTGVVTSSDTVLTAIEKLQYAISNTVYSGGSLQSVVNNGNGISNYGGNGTASIQSTNFVNNRTLYLNKDEFPTIKIVDNLDSNHTLTIDLDTININGVSHNWSSIVNPSPSVLSALPFTTDHLDITGNQYVTGDVVWYQGNVYRCLATNDSILPTSTLYWANLGAGYPLVQQPVDYNSTSGNNQILNKPALGTTVAVTADIEVGGIAAQQVIPIGTTLQEFVEDLLTKTFYPVLTGPTFSLTNNAGVREIGSSSAITLTFNFNRGDVLGNTVSGIWQPTVTQGFRAGAASSYTINGNTQGGPTLSITPTLLASGNTFTGTVTYATGIQPLDSKGNDFDDPLAGATSATQSTTVQGIYPYFWWKSSSPITAAGMQTAIANGDATKVVGVSTGTISITFAAAGEYLAFAYPDTSTTKTIWFVTSLNSGSIPGGVFGSETVLPCDSPTSLWSGIDYKIHVTAGLITESGQMQLRNS